MSQTTIQTTDELLALRDADGVIRIDADLRIECDVPWSAGKDIAGLVVDGYLDCRGDYLIILGDFKWAQAHKPAMPEKSYIKRVLPHEHQRDHWQDRLGMDLSEGCYETLCGKVLKQIVRLLNDDKWNSTERWMLETLRDSEKAVPKWVAEIRGQSRNAA